MEKNKNDELLKLFKETEEKLLSALKIEPIKLDESLSKADTRKIINSYIKKVKKVKQIFEKYESIALEIEKLTGEKEKQKEITEAVVNLREEENEKIENSVEEVVVGEKKVVITKKKKQQNKSREL